MLGNMQVSYRICLKTMNGDNLTRHENPIHNPLVRGTIEYYSTVDVANEYQRKLELAREIKQMYKCRDCAYSTKWSSDLRRHEKAVHKPSVTSSSEIKCRDCTYLTNQLCNLRRHENAVHNPSVTEIIEYHSTIDVAALTKLNCAG